MMEAVLTCSALTKAYGPNKALDNFTAVFSGGRITGLLGPNGSGKTTLMKLAAGLLVPTGGSLRVCGQAPGPQTKARGAYLPERTYLPAGLRVREVLELFCDFYADFSREKAVSMLADLKIQPGDKISAMSKGTREKVQLVLVMSRAAGLYLLDEPIGGVDPAARDYILDTIIRNYSEDAALVLSDSMDKWLRRQPELLDAVISRSHITMMNEDEAKEYAQASTVLEAGEFLLSKGAAYAVVKQGEYGATLLGRDVGGNLRMFRCPAYPLKTLVDPTGAGDTFLGALAGYLSTLPPGLPPFEEVKKGIVYGTVAASFTCESFSADALLSMTKETFRRRLEEYAEMCRLPDIRLFSASDC